jgi:hypothetical protein
MPRKIHVTDDRKRDAEIEFSAPKRAAGYGWLTPDRRKVATARLIKAPEGRNWDSILATHGGDVEKAAEALVAGDPEIDYETVGRAVGEADRVWVRHDGSVLYSARILEVVTDAAGEERSRNEFEDVEATVGEESVLPWSGRMFDVDTVVRRFVLNRKVQLRHINGLTFDFLLEIAKTLAESGKMLFVGTGSKGAGPLIFQRNGTPYRGFLEGRVDGDGGFLLVLHLSNMELKPLAKAEGGAA